MHRSTWITLALNAFALAVTGCGSTCDDAVDMICERACECGESCSVAFEGGGTIAGSDQGSCVDAVTASRNACGDADTTDYDACLADLEGAACAEGGGFIAPESCGTGK